MPRASGSTALIDALMQSLAAASFTVEQVYGDWLRSPLTPSSPDIVVVGRRS